MSSQEQTRIADALSLSPPMGLNPFPPETEIHLAAAFKF
jgi:hypothetical protein